MRIDDASALSINDPSQKTAVHSAIEPEMLSIMQIEPEDTLESVLAVLTQQKWPVIIVLPEQGSVFSQAEDFARLKQSPIPAGISFVLPRERISSIAPLAYEEGFPFTSSLPKAEASFLHQHSGSLLLSGDQAALPLLENSTEHRSTQTIAHESREDEMFSWSSGENTPVTPLPETTIPSVTRRRHSKKRQLFVLVAVIFLLVGSSVALVPMLFAQSSSSLVLKVPPHQNAPTSVDAGQLSFTSSGQLDPKSNTGLNDIVSLTLESITPPPAGMSLYAWLLSDTTQDSIAPILLGKLQIVSAKAQILYQQPHHADLLVTYSRVLITAQASTPTPTSPPLDRGTWKYQGSIPDIPTPGDEQGYSLLSHMRHLLAKDPTLNSLGLSGGLDIWLYRNAGKIFEWSNAARDDWGGTNTDLLQRQVDRVVQYMDGQIYAWRDLPANTPWLVDPKAGRPGLIDFTTPEQGPESYLSHVRLHLIGMVNAPEHSTMQQHLAEKIDAALTQIETGMQRVRNDAVQIAHMSKTQLKSQNALTLLNDMQVNANKVYIGQTTSTTGSFLGVTWIHDTLQQLAVIKITAVPQNGD